MTRNPRSFASAACAPLLLLCVALALAGCSPSWATRAGKLLKANDYDGAYEVAAEEQRSSSSPTNYQAALMAGIAADLGHRWQLAEEHLRFAASADGSNPVWVQYRSWEMLGIVKLSAATEQLVAKGWQGSQDPIGSLVSQYRRASVLVADADASMTTAVDIAAKSGNPDAALRLGIQRSAMRRIRDNIDSTGELANVMKLLPAGSDAYEAASAALRSRAAAVEAALTDLCTDCVARKRAESTGGGDADTRPADAPSPVN